MYLLACDGSWKTSPDGYLSCVGTLTAIERDELGHSGLTPEDIPVLTGQALILFAVVFGILAIKKALPTRT